MEKYYDVQVPKLRAGLFDIEVDYKDIKFENDHEMIIRPIGVDGESTISIGEFKQFSKNDQNLFEVYDASLDKWVNFKSSQYSYDGPIGFSSVRDPYAPVNAITIYISDTNKYITLVVPPAWYLDLHGTDTEPLLLYGEPLPDFVDVGFFRTEKELLNKTLEIFEDLDVISGWNSEFFDVPYIIQRIKIVLGKHHLKRMCFEGCQEPVEKEVEHFGSPEITYELSGRIHLDYLNLFKKFTFGGRESYSLAAIADEELKIPKLHYEGSLANLYSANFVTFIRYNIRDTEILHKLDEKFKFIQLTNTMAHENTVPLPAILGTVRYVDTAIINYAHNVLNKIVFDKTHKPAVGIEGALVISPISQLYYDIFSVDINSLYPNTYRTLNLSPECIVGQFTNFGVDWEGIRNGDDNDHTFEFDDNERFGFPDAVITASGAEWKKVLLAKKWSITAYGTLLDQSKGAGIIPSLLGVWYADRKMKQKLSKEHLSKANAWLENGGQKTDNEYIEEYELYEYYDMLQMTKKISLNSLYRSHAIRKLQIP